LNVHDCSSLDTFAEEIVEPAASRVFAMSAFGYGHEPAAPVVGVADGFAVMVRHPAVLALVPPLPQAAITRLAATRRAPTRR
jgi:hypothetical protein